MRLQTATRLGVVAVVASMVPGVPASSGLPGPGVAADGLSQFDNGRRAGAGFTFLGGERSRAPGQLGITGTVLDAYRGAALRIAGRSPGCRLTWQMLAGVGKIESDHARGGDVTAQGDAVRPILGPVLDGTQSAAIADSDDGRLDQDGVWDRAVGPLQFIPSSWAHFAVDGNGDGSTDPQNVFDAALATGRYLCEGGRDLSRRADLTAALYSYNHSVPYVRAVLAWVDGYAAGKARPVPNGDLGDALDGGPSAAGTPLPTASPVPSTSPLPATSPLPTGTPSPSSPAEPTAPGPVPTVTVTVTVTPSAAPIPSTPAPGPTGPAPTCTPSVTPSAVPTGSPSAAPSTSPSASAGDGAGATPSPTPCATTAARPSSAAAARAGAIGRLLDAIRRAVSP
jgi:Transglycosylase SLT domain